MSILEPKSGKNTFKLFHNLCRARVNKPIFYQQLDLSILISLIHYFCLKIERYSPVCYDAKKVISIHKTKLYFKIKIAKKENLQ